MRKIRKMTTKVLILPFSYMVVLLLSINFAYAASAWNIETVDSTFDNSNSLVLDSFNNPYISYSRITDTDSVTSLYYAKKTGPTWTRQAVNQFDVWSNSIKISSSGYPQIIFQDGSGRNLKYANLTPAGWVVTTIDSANLVGADPSIALDSINKPYVSYLYETGSDLRYAYYVGSGGNCFSTRWQCIDVDTLGNVGWYTSIILDSSKNPHISYIDWGNQKLKYAHYVGSGGNCGSNAWQCTTIDSAVVIYGSTSIALSPDGKPHIAYGYNGVKYASYVGAGSIEANCGSGEWKCVSVEGSGRQVSMAMDSYGNPRLAYIQGGNLRYASFDGAGWSMETVDVAGNLYTPSLALDSYGLPHISYHHYISPTSGELKYASLSCPDSDSDGYTSVLCGGEDCNDANSNIHPGAAEVCDGIDDDCNAATADGSGQTAPLNDNQYGVCAGSQKTCSGAAGWQNSYVSIPGYTATETTANCDGVDNDCDNQIDEGCACTFEATQDCGPITDAGECVYGEQICTAGEWGTCVGAVMPSQETCDNKDNDCDGQTDEELGSTTCGTGACKNTVQNCVGGMSQTCVPGAPSGEICGNSIDEDCDGADPPCVCSIISASWSTDIVSDGTPVSLIVVGNENCHGPVTFDIWEDDTAFLLDLFGDLFDDDVQEDAGLSVNFDEASNIATISWTALYTTHEDLLETEMGQPEYYFWATLADGARIRSSDPFPELVVTGNRPPAAPADFLIEPNGGEYYNLSANMTWNPASDPDDDALEYKIEYSDDSGATWNTVKESYGHDNTVEYNGEQKETLVMDFG